MSSFLHPVGHAKEALNLAQMQEQTLQLEQQSKLKVSGLVRWEGLGGCTQMMGPGPSGEGRQYGGARFYSRATWEGRCR
jgi:hypothetical protein